MQSVSVSGSLRVNVGKKDATEIRRAGRVPCVLYGGNEQVSFSVAYNDVLPAIYTPNVFKVELDLNGKKYVSMIKDIQFDPVSDKIIHIDFLELIPNKPVVTAIPVRITGNSIGVKAGGKLVVNVRKLKIKALPEHLPDDIEVKVDELDIGQHVRVGELSVGNVHLLDEPNKVVAAVRITRQVAAAQNEAAAGAKKK